MCAIKVERTWVVQKYGGTSVGKRLEDICGKAIPKSLECSNVAVVCSASSLSSKSTGTTNLLLECLQLAEQHKPDAADRILAILQDIRESHITILREAVRKSPVPQATEEIEASIGKDCADVEDILSAALVCPFVQQLH